MKKFSTILFLMLIPIIGVISFQIYWVNNTYKISEERLNNDLKMILAYALDNQIFTATIKELTAAGISGFNTDSLKKKSPVIFRKSNTAKNSPFFPIADFNIVNDARNIPRNILDSLKSSPNNLASIHFSTSDTSLMKMDTSVFKINTPNSAVLQNLGGVVFKFIALAKGYRVELDSLKKEYTKLLKENGIESECEIATFDNGQYIRSTNDSENLFKSQALDARQMVLPGSFYEVGVIIHEKGQFILKSMLLTIISSLLLVLVVVGGFFYMLRIIFRQKKLSQLKNDFINSMTHEFKTPIATVNAAIESVLNFGVIEDREMTKTYLDISQKELNSLNTMVEKILNISAYERNRVVFNPEKLNITEILKGVIERYKLKDSSIEFTINYLDSETAVIADRMHIRNMISNLFDNAVKYCNTKPIIQISCQMKDNFVSISVKDNGIGISKEHQKHIFDKFYRAPGDKMHMVKGFGLGLSYVKYVVQEHKGVIEIKSNLDKGTEFIIKIPVNYERN